MLLKVPLIILIGLFTINAKAEQHTTLISSEENNLNQSNVTPSKASDNHQISNPPNITTPDSKNVNINTSDSSHEKGLKNTKRSESVVDIPDSDLKQATESDKDIYEKSKDSDHLDSNISFIGNTKNSNIETDDTLSYRRLNLTDSKIKDSSLNDTHNDSQHANNTDMELKNESNNDSESQVLSRSNTHNNYELYGNGENHNETEAKLSRDTDNHNTNTKTSKGSIVNDVNDGTNKNDTSKISIRLLEPNTEDNVHKLYNNEENNNETEAISRNANNTNTKAAKESIVNDLNDGTNENDTTKLSIPHLEPNTGTSQVFKRSHKDNVHDLYDSKENHNETDAIISRSADNHNTNTKVAKEPIVNDGTNKNDTTKISIRHLEPNTEDSVHNLYDNKENHNETEAIISKSADNHNTNTKAAKEPIVNDVNDGTNETDTTKLSISNLESNTEIPQVLSKSHTDNVHNLYDNEENHNEPEAKISSNANNHNTNTKAAKEPIVNDGTNKNDTTKISIRHLEPNTEDSVHNLYDNKENHNETEAIISKSADNHNTNTKAAKEPIVNDVNDGTNETDTTKLSISNLESNTEIPQVLSKSHTDNVHNLYDNEENHNETEAKISRHANNHNTNTKAAKEPIVNNVNDGTNETDTSKLSISHLESNTEIPQVLSKSHTDNVHNLYDNEENHNETEAKISRNADIHNTNTKAAKEPIVNDVNDGTNETDTSKLSISHLESNTEIPQVLSRSHTDNVHNLYDNEENHNETEAKISRNANNHNTNTKAAKEPIVNNVNDGTNETDTSKLSISHLESNTEIPQVLSKSHTDNVHNLYDNEENHNETEAKISRNADILNTNTKAAKEPIVNDVNYGTNETDTSKLSISHLESNTEIPQVLSKSHTDNVHNLYDNEENHNETEAKISRNTDNHNTNTKAAKEPIVNDVNDGTNETDTTKLSISHLESNTEIPQVLSKRHTDNVHNLYDNEENHNETEAKISRNADIYNTNTKAATEPIVNDVNDGTNETDTTKLSISHLESNTEIPQVLRRSHTDNIQNFYDNEENHNETEAKISRNADNHNANTKALEESIVNYVNDGTIKKDSTKRDGNIHVDYDNKQIDETQSRLLLNKTKIDNEKSTDHNRGTHTVNVVFTRRSLNYRDGKKLTGTYARTTDASVITDHPITTKQNNNNYDLVGRNGFMRRNLNYDYAVNKESTEKSAKPNDMEENSYPFDSTQINVHQRNKINDFTIKDTVKPIEEANDSEDLGTAMSRSGMPGGGYIPEPYYEEPELIKPLMATSTKPPQILKTCCQPRLSSPNYGTANSFIVHPIYGNISPLFNHIKIPLLKRVYDNGNPEAVNVFHNHANPGKYEDHGINILNHGNNGIVLANKNNPLRTHENPFYNHESPLGYHENPITRYENQHLNYGNLLRSYNPSATHENLPTDYLKPQSNHENPLLRHDPLRNYENPIYGNNKAKYLANQPDYVAPYNKFQRHERSRRRVEYIDDNVYPRAVGTQDNGHQAIPKNLPTNHENPNSNYKNPLLNHGPLTNHENPLANHNVITRRVFPLNDNENGVITSLGNLTNQHADAPFYNNFRHHETVGSKEIDVDHQANREVNPVPSSQAKYGRTNPYTIASQRFPVMAVPFRRFFL